MEEEGEDINRRPTMMMNLHLSLYNNYKMYVTREEDDVNFLM
jgi:hypothetical protein